MIPRQIQSSNPIQFKTQEIQESLKNTGVFIKDSFVIKQLSDFDQYRQEEEYIPAEEDYVFALQNKDEKTPFLGVVNYYFKREGYCLNTYLNGDIYFGYYNNDLRSKQGLYSFKPIADQNFLLSQFYYGSWAEDLFNGPGIYLWLKEEANKTPFTDYNNTTFEAFVGNSIKGKFDKGALLNKKGENTFIYYGSLSEKGKKEGSNCFYYCAKLEKLCYGKFDDGAFIEGYIGKFDEKGNLTDLIIYKKLDDNNSQGEKIKINSEPDIANILRKIREVLVSKDYFYMIYEEFGKIIEFRDEKMNNIDMILTEKYEEIMKCFNYNKITLCQEIEKNLSL